MPKLRNETPRLYCVGTPWINLTEWDPKSYPRTWLLLEVNECFLCWEWKWWIDWLIDKGDKPRSELHNSRWEVHNKRQDLCILCTDYVTSDNWQRTIRWVWWNIRVLVSVAYCGARRENRRICRRTYGGVCWEDNVLLLSYRGVRCGSWRTVVKIQRRLLWRPTYCWQRTEVFRNDVPTTRPRTRALFVDVVNYLLTCMFTKQSAQTENHSAPKQRPTPKRKASNPNLKHKQ